MSRRTGAAPQNAPAMATPPSIPLDPLSIDEFRGLQRDYAVLFHKGGRDPKRIAEGKSYQDRGFDALAQERVNKLWDELFERRKRPFPDEHLKQLQEMIYIERTICFHSPTTRYQGDATLVARHPDHILVDPDLHIPTRREVDVDDEDDKDEFDLSGTRRDLWLRQFDVEMSESGLEELRQGRLSPLDLWNLPRRDERLAFHPEHDGDDDDDDDDSDVEEGPRHGSSGNEGRSVEGAEAMEEEELDDFEYKTPPSAAQQLAILAAGAGSRDDFSPAPEQADAHQAIGRSASEGDPEREGSYGGGAEIDFTFDSDGEVARDLGIGTSANPPPAAGSTFAVSPSPSPPLEPGPDAEEDEPVDKKQRTTRQQRSKATATADGGGSDKVDGKKGKGKANEVVEHTPPVEDLAPLKKTTTRTAPANMAYRPRTQGKRSRASNKVYAPRTSYAKVQLTRSVNCFSEDRLAAAFPAAAKPPKPSKATRKRQNQQHGWVESDSDGDEDVFASGEGDFKHFLLFNFRVLRTKEVKQDDMRTAVITDATVDLMEVVLRSRRDLVIVGHATPMASASECDDQGPDPTAADLELHLYGYEIRAAKLTADGIVVETSSRKYRLATAASRTFASERPNQCEHASKAASCPARLAKSYGIPYEAQTEHARRVLNLFVFARSRSIRGNHTRPRASEDEIEVAIATLARDIENELALAQNAGDDSWQQRLSPYWRIPTERLVFDGSQDGQNLFFLLPNIPFIVPDIYRKIAPHFSPNSFRTDDAERQDDLMRVAERQRAALLSRCFAVIEEDDNFDGSDAVEVLAKPQKGFHSTQTDRDGDRAVIEVYSRAKVNQITYEIGDIVLVRPGTRPFGSLQQRDSSKSLSESSRDDDDSDSASIVPQRDPTKDVDDRLWYAKIQYFWAADRDDDMEVYVHLQWFARGNAVPSVGDYLDSRQLMLLDRCDDSPAGSILAKLELVFPAVGEQPPSDKFYCLTQYNCDDGSYKDVASARPAGPLCDGEKLYRCPSCETNLEYLAGTGEAEAEGAPRPAVAVQHDAGFTLSGVEYHPHDFVYLLPHERAASAADEPGVLSPFDLAQFIAVHDELTDERGELILQLQKVERISHDALGSERLVELADREVYSVATDVAGKFFVCSPPDEDNIETFVARLEMASEHAFWTRSTTFPRCGPCQLDFEQVQALKGKLGQAMEKTARARTGKTAQHVELAHLAVYAGGGLLDQGLEKGCSLVRVRHAVEHHGPALSCLRSNALHALSSYEDAASNLVERLYYRLADPEGQEEQDDLPQPGSIFSIAGGSPCQGFSHANRYKQADDPRTFEPFVFLNYIAIYRPLVALFENVAAFTTHALPEAGSKPGSFFQLFVAVLLELGYQLRWSIVDAAGFGVPQHRRRVVVQIAARGVPLPKAPEPSHSLRRAVKPVDHRLLTDRKSSRLDKTSENWAPHAPVSVKEAWSDLPAFSVYEMQAGGKKFGFGWDAAQPPPYATPAQSTYQRAMRLEIPPDPTGELTYNSGVTFHLCHSLSDVVVARIKALKLRDDQKGEGGHLDMKNLVCYPVPPPWVTAKKSKMEKWWRRLKPQSILAPLRTKLNIDGASHGERIHFSQARPPTLRECLRAMGVPDWYELNFPSDVLDENLEESMRIIGNGVPVPLARAFGAAFFDVLAPIADAWKGDGNVWADLWHKLNGDLATRAAAATADMRDSSTNSPSPAAPVPPPPAFAAARPPPRSIGSSGSMYATTSTPFAAVESEAGPVKSKKGPNAGPSGVGAAGRSNGYGATDTDSDDDIEIVSRPANRRGSSEGTPAKQFSPDVIELSDSDTDID